MQSTKLIYLLKSLDQLEMRRLEQFVNSPFANKNETVSALFASIRKYHPDYKSPQLAKEKLFAKLFPGEAYKDGRIRYLTSQLLSVAEEFLVYNSYSADAVDRGCRLLHELNLRGLDSLFEMRQKEVEQLLGEKPVDTKSLLQHFQVAEISMYYIQRKLAGRMDELVKNLDYSEMIRSLSRFYIHYSLKMYVAMLGLGKNYKKEDAFHSLDETLETLQQEMGVQSETIRIHAACLKLMKHDDEKYYFEIRDKIVQADFKTLSIEEQKDVLIIITNFCARKYKQGSEAFLTEINTLNKFSITHGLFLREGKMSHVQFSNIVMLSIDADDTEWLDDFIEQYSVYLLDDVHESAKSFAKANLAYYRKDYKSALHFLGLAKYESPVRQTAIKNLLLKIYFDRNETELILSLVDSYLHVVKNSSLMTEDMKTGCRNFIRMYQGLYRAKQNKDREQLIRLRGQVMEEKEGVPHRWLLSKITELLN